MGDSATTETAEAHGLGGAIVVGALVGLGFLALTHHFSSTAYAYYPTASYAYYPNNHVAWCEAHFRSYSAATDSYLGFDGYYHRCVSPY